MSLFPHISYCSLLQVTLFDEEKFWRDQGYSIDPWKDEKKKSILASSRKYHIEQRRKEIEAAAWMLKLNTFARTKPSQQEKQKSFTNDSPSARLDEQQGPKKMTEQKQSSEKTMPSTHTKEATRKKSLGRGLATLFQDYDYVAVHAKESNSEKKESGTELEIGKLNPGNYQPRHHFDQKALEALAESIKQKGVLQPILVKNLSDGKYSIVAGERRYRAAKLAGLTKIPVIIKNISDEEAAEIVLIENVQREDLTPIEEAKGYRALIGQYNYTHEKLATAIGKSRSYVTNIVRLMDLPGKIQDMIDDGRLSFSHARLLFDLKQPEKVVETIINQNLNVRAAEQLIARQKDQKQIYKAKKETPEEDYENVREIENQLKSILNIKTKIAHRGTSGRLTFYYKNLEDLDKILRIVNMIGEDR